MRDSVKYLVKRSVRRSRSPKDSVRQPSIRRSMRRSRSPKDSVRQKQSVRRSRSPKDSVRNSERPCSQKDSTRRSGRKTPTHQSISIRRSGRKSPTQSENQTLNQSASIRRSGRRSPNQSISMRRTARRSPSHSRQNKTEHSIRDTVQMSTKTKSIKADLMKSRAELENPGGKSKKKILTQAAKNTI